MRRHRFTPPTFSTDYFLSWDQRVPVIVFHPMLKQPSRTRSRTYVCYPLLAVREPRLRELPVPADGERPGPRAGLHNHLLLGVSESAQAHKLLLPPHSSSSSCAAYSRDLCRSFARVVPLIRERAPRRGARGENLHMKTFLDDVARSRLFPRLCTTYILWASLLYIVHEPRCG